MRQQCLTITCSIVAPHVGYGDMHACGSLVLSRIFFSFPFFFFANLSLRYVFREISSYCFGKVHVKGSKRGLLKLKGEDDIEIEKPLISISRQRTSNCLCAYPLVSWHLLESAEGKANMMALQAKWCHLTISKNIN